IGDRAVRSGTGLFNRNQEICGESSMSGIARATLSSSGKSASVLELAPIRRSGPRKDPGGRDWHRDRTLLDRLEAENRELRKPSSLRSRSKYYAATASPNRGPAAVAHRQPRAKRGLSAFRWRRRADDRRGRLDPSGIGLIDAGRPASLRSPG